MTPDRPMEQREAAAFVGHLLDACTPKQAEAVRLVYGVDGEDPHRIAEAAAALGITAPAVAVRLNAAFRKMRERARYLGPCPRAYMDEPCRCVDCAARCVNGKRRARRMAEEDRERERAAKAARRRAEEKARQARLAAWWENEGRQQHEQREADRAEDRRRKRRADEMRPRLEIMDWTICADGVPQFIVEIQAEAKHQQHTARSIMAHCYDRRGSAQPGRPGIYGHLPRFHVTTDGPHGRILGVGPIKRFLAQQSREQGTRKVHPYTWQELAAWREQRALTAGGKRRAG